jgi:hypothetical protein
MWSLHLRNRQYSNMGILIIFTLSFDLYLLCLLTMSSFQARSDIKMEFFHLISFLLSHCMNKWRVPNDQVKYRFICHTNMRLKYLVLSHCMNKWRIPNNQVKYRFICHTNMTLEYPIQLLSTGFMVANYSSCLIIICTE